MKYYDVTDIDKYLKNKSLGTIEIPRPRPKTINECKVRRNSSMPSY